VTEYYLAWNELTPKTAKHGEDVWAARPHPLLRINSGLFQINSDDDDDEQGVGRSPPLLPRCPLHLVLKQSYNSKH